MIIWPEYIGLNDWAANLSIDYPEEFIPILENEKDWEDWGSIVASTGIFARLGIPPPFTIADGVKKNNFATWQEWAQVVYSVVLNAN